MTASEDDPVRAKRSEATGAHGKPDPGERPGATIGRYVIVSRLGEGSMGMVYLAYDPKLDRRLALKVLRRRARSSRATQERQQRLRREAMAMAQLNHANVVTVHDVGVAEGRVFLAMDYLEGQTLRDWIDAKRRPWNQVLRKLVYAGQGLAAAHAAGVIHRDFKPENVLVGNDGSVKVMDFGLARPRTGPERSSGVTDVHGAAGKRAAEAEAEPDDEAEADDEPREWWKAEGQVDLTRSGDVLGTPSYMAPELFDGGEANAQSDQFAFCVALWEALYGVRPFAGETMAALAFNTKRGQITSPPRRARVPAWLGRLVRRGLSTAPDRRWPSMQALLDTLVQGAGRRRVQRAGLAAVGLVVLGGGLSYALVPAAEPCRGGRDRMDEVWNDDRAAAITAAFEATGVSYAGEALVRARQRVDDYAGAWVGVYTEVCEATAVHARQSPEELDRRIACLDARLAELDALLQVLVEADKRVAERAAQAASALRSPTTCAAEELHDPEADDADPERKRVRQDLRARMLRAEALERAGRYDDAAALAREIAAEAELHAQSDLHGEALVQLGMAEDEAGDYATAADHLRQAYFVANAQGLDLVSAKAAVALITTEGLHMARSDEGLSWARHAEVALQRGDPGNTLWGRYHSALGLLHMQRFELAEARKHVEQALALERDALGDDHERVALLLTWLGIVLEQTGRSEDAVASFEQAIEIHRRALGPHHPDLAGLHNNYAVILFGRQDWPGAQAQLEQAVALQREALGDHPNTALTIDNLGSTLVLQGKVKEGRALIEQALAMREKTLGAEHPAVAQSLTNLGGTLAEDDDWGGARRLYERALAIMEKAGGPGNQQVVLLLTNLGSLDLREGAAQSGHDRCQQAAAIVEKEGGPTARDLPDPLMCLGWAQLELEQPQAALESLERALAIRGEGQADYGAMLRLLLSRALVKTSGDAERAAELREEARTRYRKLDEEPPERVAAWLRDPG
jgi:tetratricopeptide (TPR) repeat protein/tRNA A-37 threonylcarbamoyl transferase component Bud32